MPELASGLPVRISNPDRGSVTGRITHLCRPSDLPNLPGLPDGHLDLVRAIITDLGVSEVAWLEYSPGPSDDGRQLVFAALRDRDGAWFDLQGQALRITPL